MRKLLMTGRGAFYKLLARATLLALSLFLCQAAGAGAEEPPADPCAEGHAWGDWAVTLPATCEEAGEETRVCQNDPTHVETRVLPATGHVWGEWQETVPATCEEAGIEISVCLNDPAHTETRPLPALGHTPDAPVRGNEIAPTCEEAGSYDEIVFCAVCGQELSRTTVVLPAVGHVWSEWVVTTPSTCEEEGVETSVCLNDEAHVETRAIPALGHTPDAPVRLNEATATCTTPGSYEEIVFCTVCGQVLSRETVSVGAPLGHDLIHVPAAAAQIGQDGNEEYFVCAACGLWFADADGRQEIADHASVVVRVQNRQSIAGNSGTIQVNLGAVRANYGTIIENYGTIALNRGRVRQQYYRIAADFATAEYTLTPESGFRWHADQDGVNALYLQAGAAGVLTVTLTEGTDVTLEAAMNGQPLAVQREGNRFTLTAPAMPRTEEGFAHNTITLSVQVAVEEAPAPRQPITQVLDRFRNLFPNLDGK